ncbi:MAG: hypothetical protein FJ088_09640, partial [Deltaproteobacteria bacterium]|nr:hypothetical protein [Deltaproteobacteria bacterium]
MNKFLRIIVLLFFSCSSQDEKGDILYEEADMIETAETEAPDYAAEEELQETIVDAQDAAGDIAGEEIELEEVQWKQLGVPFPEDFVFKGIHGFNEGSIFLVGAGAVAYMFNGYEFEDLGAPPSAEMLNTVWGSSPSIVWTGGIKGALLKYDGSGWTGGGFCKEKSDCIQTDDCLIPACANGACLYSPSQAEGCCGFPALEKDFDDGTLQGFTVKDIYEGVPNSGGIVWNVISHIDVQTGMPRYTSPPYALYFGIPDKPCYFDPSKKCPNFDNGKIVGATAVSENIELPDGEKAILKFNVFIDAEQPNSYDLLKISVISGGIEKDVWDKSMVGGVTNKQFVPAEADISDFLGKEIKISISFDSKDPIANQTEGVFK